VTSCGAPDASMTATALFVVPKSTPIHPGAITASRPRNEELVPEGYARS